MAAREIIAQAYAYVDRGWAVIPLREAGILPAEKDWPNRACRTRADVDTAWSINPGANVGIVTGRLSGIWVLDIDPGNGGEGALAGLVQAYGRLPETYTVATPSGGTHYYFLMPGDFEPRNAQHGRRAGRLPVGIDVRGWHGYVAAPPTERAAAGTKPAGRYALLTDFALSPAPEWLLDMIRPAEIPTQAEPGVAESPLRFDQVTAMPLERVRAVLDVAIPAELHALAAAMPGSRNETAFRVAVRFWDFISAGWANHDQLYDAYVRAGSMANIDGQFPESELARTWVSARRVNAGQPAELRDIGVHGTVIDFAEFGPGAAGFSAPGTATTLTTTMPAPGAGAGFEIVDPADSDQTATVDPQAELRERLVTAEMSRQWVRDEAGRRLRAMGEPPFVLEILDRAAQRDVPRPKPLVQGWLAQGQIARVYGPPGAGKSFVAVELAACVSTGRLWHGLRVAAGDVAYLAPEDPAGVALRLRAWERHHDTEHRVHLVPLVARLDDDAGPRILAALHARFPAGLGLVVVDTQAMATAGMDENSAADMGIFVRVVKSVAETTGATCLIVHHSGVKGGRARGSTSILGAMDVEMEASITGRTVMLMSTKQKNTAKPVPIMMNLHTIDMGELDDFGQSVTSAVLVAAGDPGTPVVIVDPSEALPTVARRAVAIATVLLETNATGETYTRVRARATQVTDFGKNPTTITSNFSRAWAYLVERGRVAKAMGREAFYFIPIEGASMIDANPDKKVIGGPETYVPMDVD